MDAVDRPGLWHCTRSVSTDLWALAVLRHLQVRPSLHQSGGWNTSNALCRRRLPGQLSTVCGATDRSDVALVIRSRFHFFGNRRFRLSTQHARHRLFGERNCACDDSILRPVLPSRERLSLESRPTLARNTGGLLRSASRSPPRGNELSSSQRCATGFHPNQLGG